MKKAMKSDETTEIETSTGSSGSITLNGEAWKNRDDTTYTSLLDMYGATDLFSYKSMNAYNELEHEKLLQQQELTEYLFLEQLQSKHEEEDIVDQIFSQEIQLSKVRNYSRSENDYVICYVMAEILFVLVFICILMKFSVNRRKRRKEYAVEINMEN